MYENFLLISGVLGLIAGSIISYFAREELDVDRPYLKTFWVLIVLLITGFSATRWGVAAGFAAVIFSYLSITDKKSSSRQELRGTLLAYAALYCAIIGRQVVLFSSLMFLLCMLEAGIWLPIKKTGSQKDLLISLAHRWWHILIPLPGILLLW